VKWTEDFGGYFYVGSEDKRNLEGMGSADFEQLVKRAKVVEVEHVVVDRNIVSAHFCRNIPVGALEERISKDTVECESLPPETTRLALEFDKFSSVCFVFQEPACHLVQVILQERE